MQMFLLQWGLPKKVWWKNLKKQLANKYNFYNHEFNKFILLLQKSVYKYECMDHW